MSHLEEHPLVEARKKLKVTIARLFLGFAGGAIAGLVPVSGQWARLITTLAIGVALYASSILFLNRVLQGYSLRSRLFTGVISYVFALLVGLAFGYALTR